MASSIVSKFCSPRTAICRLSYGSVRFSSSDIHDSDFKDSNVDPRRQVSGLKPYIRAKMDHALQMQRIFKTNPKYPKTKFAVGDRYAYLRKRDKKLYAKFGRDSQLNAGLAWPSRSELRTILSEEELFDPTLDQVLEKRKKEMEPKIKAIENRMKDIKENLAKMPEMIAAYEKSKQQKMKIKEEQAKKQQALLDEAREYFGYAVDADDLRFQQMMEEKEAAAKEKTRLAKKAKKAEAFQLKIEAVAAELKEKQPEGKD